MDTISLVHSGVDGNTNTLSVAKKLLRIASPKRMVAQARSKKVCNRSESQKDAPHGQVEVSETCRSSFKSPNRRKDRKIIDPGSKLPTALHGTPWRPKDPQPLITASNYR